jgi:hypothetical protein
MNEMTGKLFKLFYSIENCNAFSALARFGIMFLFAILTEWRSMEFKLSFRRLFFLLLLLLIVPLLMLWNFAGFVLDDIFFPQWRKQEISSPIFIIGNARSGTTWLHRLLCIDEDQFCFFRTWELLFGVSVTWRKLIIMCYNLDQAAGGYIYAAVCRSERQTLARYGTHPIGLQLAEEDDWLMMHINLSQLITFFFPTAPELFGPIIAFDSNLPPSTRKCILDFYTACIRRCLFVRSRGRRLIYLSKSPPFTNRIDLLSTAFPDCRIICLVRDPVQAVPSMISYISEVGKNVFILSQ